ncbi:hypothetical protein J4E90_002843 [Alternaria incomplexa]|uniref:uncharacterized protein n=1 Tax=Alternaria incomplexa TaxID=1187928 RepID=UPI00221F99D4|nr:uncharacterized protein J4E90_002843 [Alternaria incomplexa]KAI4918459.1 hypothetical protein J4E90_002843 [Alternaria incomplexa]
MSSASTAEDVEKAASGTEYAHLTNDEVKSFSWENITVTVKDRTSKQPIDLLSNVSGMIEAGEMMALMGPSGSGKTTLLNILAHRAAIPKATIQQTLRVNGAPKTLSSFRKLSSYVEQEDALIGSLTVRETLYFAAQLALPSSIPPSSRKTLITSLLTSFGLTLQSNTLIGTPIRKGVSGGQKRRVSVASQLITSPRILFLDEPTSGLDSAASYEVIKFVRDIAKKYRILVVATEFVIDLINTDFSHDSTTAQQRLTHLHTSWATSPAAASLTANIRAAAETASSTPITSSPTASNTPTSALHTTLTLTHRSFLKSHRDIVAYGIRIAMYLGLAIMMGTVWLRLSPTQSNIQAFTNAIFFGGAFMSFMAVAYIPAYLEDLAIYSKERANGLYGPTAFMLSNFVVGVPYLFLITILFSVVSYWLGNFRPGADGFWIRIR